MCKGPDIAVEEAELDDALLALFRAWKGIMREFTNEEDLQGNGCFGSFIRDIWSRLEALDASGENTETFNGRPGGQEQ